MRNQAAYTLIELLVAIILISIIFIAGYAGFRSFSQRQQLVGVGKSITSDLRLIQQLSSTGQKPQSAACTRLLGYIFNITSSSHYNLRADCQNGLVTTKSVDLPGNTSISPTSLTIKFKAVGQGTNLSSSTNLTLTQSGTSSQVILTIDPGGSVK